MLRAYKVGKVPSILNLGLVEELPAQISGGVCSIPSLWDQSLCLPAPLRSTPFAGTILLSFAAFIISLFEILELPTSVNNEVTNEVLRLFGSSMGCSVILGQAERADDVDEALLRSSVSRVST